MIFMEALYFEKLYFEEQEEGLWISDRIYMSFFVKKMVWE